MAETATQRGRRYRQKASQRTLEGLSAQEGAIVRVLLKRALYHAMQDDKPESYVRTLASTLVKFDNVPSNAGVNARTRSLLARAYAYECEQKRRLGNGA